MAAPDARIIWHADLDPGTLRVSAASGEGSADNIIDPVQLAPWLTIVSGQSTAEHVVLSDGWHRIRLDVEQGSLAAGKPIMLHYRLAGVASVEPQILPLRRLIHLYRHGYFAPSLYPPDRRVERWLLALRVGDAIASGASHREIAGVLFGREQRGSLGDPSFDSFRSRVRRLAADARFMARGGFRWLSQVGRSQRRRRFGG